MSYTNCHYYRIEMSTYRFFDFFPPPIFLTMPAVGLSVESDLLRLVSFEKKHGRTVLKTADEFKLESGTIVAGDIAKPDKLVAVLKNIRNEHGARFARVALPEEKAYVYEAIIPVPEDGEMSDAVEFSLDQNIPLSPAEVIFDFAVVEGPFSSNGVQSVRVAVSAYSKGLIETWVGFLRQADIIPLSLTSESQAIAHSLVVQTDTRPFLLVHFLKDKTIVAVVSGGFARFSTTVSGGSGGGLGGGSEGINHAEKILASHEGEKIHESIELLSVRDEVKKVFSYWMSKEEVKSQKERRGIKSVIVTGHVADMIDVAEYLGKHVGVPAILGNVWQNAFSLDKFIPEIEFEDSLCLAAAVGVALPK